MSAAVSEVVTGLAVSVGGDKVFFTTPHDVALWHPTAAAISPSIYTDAMKTFTGPLAVSGSYIVSAITETTTLRTLALTLNGLPVGPFAQDVAPLPVADDSEVYWQGFAHYTQLDAMGGGASIIPSGFVPADYLAADNGLKVGGFLYLIAGTQISRLAKDIMSSAGAVPSGVVITKAQGLAVASTTANVYWLEDTGGCSLASGRLMKLIWGAPAVVLADNLRCPRNLAIDTTYAYFTTGAPSVTIPAVHVFRVPL